MEHEGGGGSVRVVGRECDPYTYQLPTLHHLHRAVPLSNLHLNNNITGFSPFIRLKVGVKYEGWGPKTRATARLAQICNENPSMQRERF